MILSLSHRHAKDIVQVKHTYHRLEYSQECPHGVVQTGHVFDL